MNAQHDAAQRRAEHVKELWDAGHRDIPAIARAAGCSERQAYRITGRLGLRAIAGPQDAHIDWARIDALAAEGMPATFIAEDVGVDYSVAQRRAQRAPNRDQAVEEWRSVWHEIRKSAALTALHREFAPVFSAKRAHSRRGETLRLTA